MKTVENSMTVHCKGCRFKWFLLYKTAIDDSKWKWENLKLKMYETEEFTFELCLSNVSIVLSLVLQQFKHWNVPVCWFVFFFGSFSVLHSEIYQRKNYSPKALSLCTLLTFVSLIIHYSSIKNESKLRKPSGSNKSQKVISAAHWADESLVSSTNKRR